jgi:3',5'-nucleoside bisphosphate phosphatase
VPGVADLHTHSTRSDGALDPAALVEAARAAGVTILALTDHDSVAGIAEASAAAAAAARVELVPGVELSFRDAHPAAGLAADHHLLGLFVDPLAPGLLAFLEALQEGRREMARETVAALGRLGLPISWERVQALAAGATVTRPHIARALVEAGHVASEREAFERLLGNGKPAAVERPAPSPAAAIAAVRAAGGVASLAHPVFAHDADAADRLAALPAQLDRLVADGLAAVECSYPDATPALGGQLRAWARERDLAVSGGSDYHGPGRAPYMGLGHSAVDEAAVAALRARRLPAKLDRA